MSAEHSKILFVSHDASRTGAPIVLLHLIRWLKQNTGYEINILLLGNGPLKQEFELLGNTFLWDPQPPQPGWKKVFLDQLFKGKIDINRKYFMPRKLRQAKYELIYSNTVVSNHALPFLKQFFKCKMISHVHENEFTINAYYRESFDQVYLNAIDHFIAVSESTKKNLLDYKIRESDISLCYEFVPVKSFFSLELLDKDNIKDKYKLKDSFIVGGCGLTNWRKGIDLFLQTVIGLNQKYPENNIIFLWVGHRSDEFKFQFEYEVKRINQEQLGKKVIFIDSVPQPQNYFQLFDIFFLSSREDPFPLVMLENAALGKPVFCFGKSGGPTEFVGADAGVVVPYADVNAMADAIFNYSQATDKLEAMGQNALGKVQQYDIENGAAHILQIIQKIIK